MPDVKDPDNHLFTIGGMNVVLIRQLDTTNKTRTPVQHYFVLFFLMSQIRASVNLKYRKDIYFESDQFLHKFVYSTCPRSIKSVFVFRESARGRTSEP